MVPVNADFPLSADPTSVAERLLTAHGLPATPLVPANGWSNRVWLAPAHVVRLSSGRFRDAFAHEAAVLRLLAPTVPHAAVRAYGRIGNREWLIQDRLPGRPLAHVWVGLTTAHRRSAIEQLGMILRALHAVPLPAGFGNPSLADALAPGGQARDAYHAPPDRYHVVLTAVRDVPGADQALLAEVEAFIVRRLAAFAGDTPSLVHSDVHFANLLWDDGRLTALLDFEGARPAVADQELDTLLRCCREPALYRGGDQRAWPTQDDLTAVPAWLAVAYPALFAHPRLAERLAVYDALWHLIQALHFPLGSSPPDPWGHLRALLEAGGQHWWR